LEKVLYHFNSDMEKKSQFNFYKALLISNKMMIFYILILIATISLTLYNTFPLVSFCLVDAQIINTNSSNILQNTQSLQQQNTTHDNLIIGSFGNDRISGTTHDDIIVALSGSDTAHGLANNDKIQGNEETDQLYGDDGDDIVQGGSGSDILNGGSGDDVIAGGTDDDYLIGGTGNDKLYGDIGDDILSGQQGADYFDCGDGVDVIVDFSLNESDDTAGNCEEIQNKLNIN
jgi:Ca2+-binding RTX toxin-like protein